MPNVDQPPTSPNAGIGKREGGGAMPSPCPFCAPPDPGDLRAELAEIYTRDLLMPSMHRRAVRLIQRLARITGVAEEEVIAHAVLDAACLRPETEAVA
jgi:hypothetical protein